MKYHTSSWTAAVALLFIPALFTFLLAPSPATAQQPCPCNPVPFQGGLVATNYSSGTATVEARLRTTQDFSGGEVTNIVYTVRAPLNQGVTFGDASSNFGLAGPPDEEGTYTVGGQEYTYAVYAGSQPTFQDFTAGDPVTVATFDVGGDPSDVIELVVASESGPDDFPTGTDGRYYVEYDGVGYFAADSNADPDVEFYQTTTSQQPGATSLSTSTIPVELASLTGQADGRTAVLEWTTYTEENNRGFYVEQKDGEGSWSTVSDLIEGAGNSQSERSYTARVEDLDYGTHVFRLRQEDTDGTPTPSDKTARVEMRMSEAYVLEGAYPNPVQSRATLKFSVRTSQAVTVELYNTLGQRVRVLHQGVVPESQTVTLNVSAGGLASGLYFVRLRGEDFAASESVTVIR